ncbi:transcriptional regulator [Citrobacter rodentium]|nr:winged helix-turn-helix domain-containing protein [Citrobacter rodentium]KIQ51186.1 CadC family transcriptional regulator [Citrobacter rodentium]QBY32138.1 CadC family transcriptional regulator [Citrobacter rodentium]UHO33610.1 winged helix-turn-helix domain-containing protein [Citrobacter rodentium NBRC 105723 = DSM 16636]HAT8014134.1 CadC family transcriptional regulator [Citrobacter rodentium NBRC 105723 = DSM 16636]HAT8019071.1 CadC family transcriptional regulator [Citrobacter rodentiu
MSIVVNNWRMDSSLNALIHCETGETRRLGEYHFILLETLAKNADSVLSRSYLMAEVWKNRIVGGNSLPTAIHALRVAIDDDGKQQEIIKTIPKKGYLFNKDYLTIEYSSEAAEHVVLSENKNKENLTTTDFTAAEATAPWPLTADEAADQQLPSTAVVPPPAEPSRRRNTLFIGAGIAVIALFLLSLIYYFQAPTTPVSPDSPRLVKETFDHADNMEIYHLYTSTTNKKSTSLLAQHISPAIARINELLKARNAKLTLYYKFALNKFTLDMVLDNQCDSKWQLALNFENWQNKDNETNTVMYQEVEKMLNEMPECN